MRRETYQRAGAPVPDELWPPRLLPGLDEWLAAFWEMSNDRSIGSVAGPIPAASIDRWLMLGRVGQNEFSTFRHCIRRMDQAWREASAAKSEAGGDDKIADAPLTPGAFKRITE